jgi:hypothetical protein
MRISCNVYWLAGEKECYPNTKDYDDFGIEKKSVYASKK